MTLNVYTCFCIAWILTIQIQDIGAYFEAEINIVNLPSEQPSNLDNTGTADHGNDGKTNTDYANGQCTATNDIADPWWQVDLRVYRNVYKVEILNRGDCCAEKLTDVTVLMANNTITDSTTTTVQCGVYEGTVESGGWGTITCDQPTLGRYLILKRIGVTSVLTVCEVKVHGRFENTLTRVASESQQNNNYPTLVNQYTLDTKEMIPDIDASLGANYLSLQLAETALYKSPVVDCSWNHILGVQLTVFNDDKAMMTVDFDTSSDTDTKSNFYSFTYLRATTYEDLNPTHRYSTCAQQAGFFNIAGDAGLDRRFFLHCLYSGCGGDFGWLVVLDMNHVKICDWEESGGLYPAFLYSEAMVYTNALTYSWADVMTFTAFMGDAFGGCVSDCNLMEDGDYQSCLACNIYVTCSSQTLKYKMCLVGLEFDKNAESCISTSTTCHETGFAEEGCYPDGCSPSPCANDGVCSSDKEGFTCECATGFTGDTCETNINDCHNNTCLNGGNCTDGVNDFSCDCVDGFVDKDCGTNFDDCATDPCGDHGECDDQINGYECTCHDGFQGDDCDINVNECASNPCQNDGTCSDGDNEYTCECVLGFDGDDCSENIDDCNHDLCTNGAECIDGVNEYTCACPAGYTGDDCSTNIDECANSPCLQNGTCTDGINEFTCTCAAPYKGDTCDEIDGCDGNNPCQNGGTCTDADDTDSVDYTCTCVDDYAGTTCQNHKVCSASSPCENGECEDGEDGTTYSCTCSEGYSGTNCDESSDGGSADALSSDSSEDTGGFNSTVLYILIAALAFGVLIIFSCMIFLIITRKRQKKEEEQEKPKNAEEELNKKPNNQPPWATKIEDKYRNKTPKAMEKVRMAQAELVDF